MKTPANAHEFGVSPRAELPAAVPEVHQDRDAASELGEPLDLKAVARLIGCSPWTVRQVLIPDGLPCFRAAANGKLIFYRQQVVRWVLRHQRTRGGRR
jgi:hypothetical protein